MCVLHFRTTDSLRGHPFFRDFNLQNRSVPDLQHFLLVTNSMPSSGRVDRACATETVDRVSIPSLIKPKPIKLVFTASLLDIRQ